MGTAASVNNKPRCPYHRLCEKQIRKAMNTRYVDGTASDFYFHCSNGDIDQVRQILEAPGRQPIDELVKLERNGNTALHVATEKGHIEIVKLLLEHKCFRTILNRNGKVAYEEATTPAMQKLFIRSENSDRFHETNTSRTMAHFLLKENKQDKTSNESNTASNGTDTTTNEESQFFRQFKSEDEVFEFSLNHQTTAMWLRFFNWFSRKFPRFFQRDNLNLDTFNLHKNVDFKKFLEGKLGDKYQETLEEFDKAHQKNSIEPLLTIYSKENIGFYRSLNRQLVDSPNENDTSPHLCDRFIIEFHIRGDEIEKRSFVGTAYRGATISSKEVLLYEKVCSKETPGVITFKAFTSTSEEVDVALQFIIERPAKNGEVAVLYVIETKTKSPTIMGIADVSEFKHEKEILFMPGNLFRVNKVERDVVTYTKHQQKVIVTKIHLEYLHRPVSFWKKLKHTYQAAQKNDVV